MTDSRLLFESEIIDGTTMPPHSRASLYFDEGKPEEEMTMHCRSIEFAGNLTQYIQWRDSGGHMDFKLGIFLNRNNHNVRIYVSDIDYHHESFGNHRKSDEILYTTTIYDIHRDKINDMRIDSLSSPNRDVRLLAEEELKNFFKRSCGYKT